MRKLGPILAIASGLALVLFAGLSMADSMGALKGASWLGDFKNIVNGAATKNTTATAIYAVLISFGAIEIILGLFAWSNPHGLAAIILLGLIVTSIVLSIISGKHSHSFPTGTIIIIVVEGIASLGMISGFINRA